LHPLTLPGVLVDSRIASSLLGRLCSVGGTCRLLALKRPRLLRGLVQEGRVRVLVLLQLLVVLIAFAFFLHRILQDLIL